MPLVRDLNLAVIIRKHNNGEDLSYWEQKLFDFWYQQISSRVVSRDESPEEIFKKKYGHYNINETTKGGTK